MPFIFPGSSEQLPPTLTPLAEPAPEVLDKLAALSVDEPLPETYAGDRIRLLAQSPYRLYLYWSHARDPFETLRRAFGARAAAPYKLAVRLEDTLTGEETFFEAPPARNFWFDVRPGRRYRAHVGLFAEGRPFVRLLSSEAVTTPRVTVSRRGDAEDEFRVTAPEFAQVLNAAGYASDALEVTLEAADEATHDETTRRLVETFIGAGAPVRDDSLAEMRELLAALAFGVAPERLFPLLSPPLARWLREAVGAHRPHELDPPRLLDLLRSTLALELEYDERYDAAAIEAARRAARFVWGASDVQMPAPGPRLWLPSMNEGLVTRPARWKRKR